MEDNFISTNYKLRYKWSSIEPETSAYQHLNRLDSTFQPTFKSTDTTITILEIQYDSEYIISNY